MSILLQTTSARGVPVTHHVVTRVSFVRSGNGLVQCMVDVASWPSSVVDGPAMDKHTLAVPIEVGASDPFSLAETFLTSDSDSFLFGGTIQVDAPIQTSLETAKAKKIRELMARRSEVEFTSFVWDNKVFDSDMKSQSRIQGAVILAMQALSAQAPFSIKWTLADNSVCTLSAADMVQVGLALATHVGTQHEIARILRTSIEEAVSIPEVESVTWP